MGTTKRTTANVALDTNGQKVRLLKNGLSDGFNRLSYAAIVEAVNNGSKIVPTEMRYSDGTYERADRNFGKSSFNMARSWTWTTQRPTLVRGDKYFRIGCHIFTLKMFNRILRAAGIRTTKPQTLKTFAAAA